MNIAQGSETFTNMFPDMMKATKLLIINHDVTRYHSFDLLRYTLFSRKDLFITLKPEYQRLIVPHTELAEQVQFMRTKVPVFNVFDMFNTETGVHTLGEYAEKMRAMIAAGQSVITPTDVSDRFDVVFDKPNITGFLLQYRGEKNRPSCYDKLTVYEDTNILDLEMAAKIIRKHMINAVMISSNEMAVRLVTKLLESGYTQPITFMIARYAYNFHTNKNMCVVPTYNSEMGFFELRCRHEFGFFDPFSGLTYRFRYLKESQQLEE